MSAATLPFDSGFNHFSMGGRSSFTWPVLESSNHSLLSHDVSSYGSNHHLSAIPRSITHSPPRGAFTAQQRELKRQRDQARRDSKIGHRMRRAGSSASSSHERYDASSPPSSTISDMTSSTSSLPVYTTASGDVSLLAEPTTLAPQLVLPSYSPSLSPSPHAVSYGSYQHQPYMDYQTYGSSSSSALSTHYGVHNRAQEPSSMYHIPPIMSAPSTSPSSQDGSVRVVQSRPKPQCWEHGCNGRQFSTFSNLLRHQREKSGQASKASCPNCGAEFTRTTARNGHLLHDKCKRRNS